MDRLIHYPPTQIRALVEALRDIVAVLAEADVEDKAALYTELGVSLTYHPDGRVQVETRPRGVEVRVGGAITTFRRALLWQGSVDLAA